MSTPNVTPNNPTQPAAATPPAATLPTNQNDMTPQQLRDLAAGVPAPQQVAQPGQEAIPNIPGLPPIERQQDGTLAMRLPTGQIYKGTNVTELFTQVVQGQVNASTRITELNTEAQRLRDGLAAVTGQPVGTTPGQSQFDRAVYMELQAQDPILAANYLDQHRFGLPNINDVVPYYTRTAQSAEEFRTAQTVNTFRIMSPDFPGTEQAVNEVMGFMKANSIPFTAPNLKLVHDGMVKAGKYQPLQITMPGQPAQPTIQIPGMPPIPVATQPGAPGALAPVVYDPSPAGNYGFGPGGFGTQAPPPAPVQVAVPSVIAPPPVAVPTAGYPPIPQQAVPLPMPQVTPIQAPPGAVSEAQVNAMDTATLRQYIESNLQR